MLTDGGLSGAKTLKTSSVLAKSHISSISSTSLISPKYSNPKHCNLGYAGLPNSESKLASDSFVIPIMAGVTYFQ